MSCEVLADKIEIVAGSHGHTFSIDPLKPFRGADGQPLDLTTATVTLRLYPPSGAAYIESAGFGAAGGLASAQTPVGAFVELGEWRARLWYLLGGALIPSGAALFTVIPE